MNIYFLVEGVAELKVYPIWIEYLLEGRLTRSNDYTNMSTDQYYIFEGGGASNMLNHSIPNAISEIATNPVFDYFVVVMDAEDDSITARKTKVETSIQNAGDTLPNNCTVQILIQQVCFETWLCGHIPHYRTSKTSSNKNVRMYVDAYNAEIQDPELMPPNPTNLPALSHLSIGKYHFSYLHHMLLPGAKYSKGNANSIADTAYLDQLVQRLMDSPTHLRSLEGMIIFMALIKTQL